MGTLPGAHRPEPSPPGDGWDTGTVAVVASRQYGLITTAQLRAAGLSDSAIKQRVRERELHRLHRGVYAVGHLALPPLAREAAALLACGPGAMLSHRSAAGVWGLMEWRGFVEVTVPRARHPRPPGITVHRPHDLPQPRRHQGLLLTSPARAILDLTAVVSASELERVVAEAHARRLADPGELYERGTARLRHVLDGGPRLTRSEAERRFLRLVDRAGLPRPETNVRIAGHEVDALWREQRVVVEIDGYAFHGHRLAFEDDRAKDRDLREAGLIVVRITWRQLRDEPERTVAHLATLLAAPFWIRSTTKA